MKTLNKILIIIGGFLALFIITMIVLFCIFQSIPDTLVIGVLGSGGTECILCAIIEVVKLKHRKEESEDDSNIVWHINNNFICVRICNRIHIYIVVY